jgi:hypothetical protein
LRAGPLGNGFARNLLSFDYASQDEEAAFKRAAERAGELRRALVGPPIRF